MTKTQLQAKIDAAKFTYIGKGEELYLKSLLTGLNEKVPGIWSGIGSAFTSYAKGDLIYASDTDILSKLAADADGKVLTMNSGVPVWSTPSGGATDTDGLPEGSTNLYFTDVRAIAAVLPDQTGNGGKYLSTDGSAVSWATVSSSSSLPDMTGNSGKYLTNNGTIASWGVLTGWATTGNLGTDGGTTNFIGTTDAKSLVVKTNNTTAFTINTSQSIILGNGNTPSKEYIYYRSIGGTSASVGIGLNSSYGLGFFTGTNLAPFKWLSGGITGSQMMALSSTGLSVTGGIAVTGAITGVTDLSVPGTLSASFINGGNSYNTVKQYFRDLGVGGRAGIAFVASLPGIQNFCRALDIGWSWNFGGDMQTSTVNEQMRLVAAGLGLLNGILVGSSSGTRDSSSIAEFRSTTSGILTPRMTTTQWGMISSKAEGLQAWDNVAHAPVWYDGTGDVGFRYNRSTSKFQGYDGTSWIDLN